MGSSTGIALGCRACKLIKRLLACGSRRIAVHSEDEARLVARRGLALTVENHPLWRDARTAWSATSKLIEWAKHARRSIHVLHVSTALEAEKRIANAKRAGLDVSMEVTPQHLTLAAPQCYRELGSLAQMNPPIRRAHHRAALWRAVRAGLVDTIGSDHAPHTLTEKANPYPNSPSGMPGVQTLLPLMLDHVAKGRLSLTRLIELTSTNPALLFGLRRKGRIALGFDADLTLVDMGKRQKVDDNWLASRCGWSPFTGRELTGWPVMVMLNGQLAMREGAVLGAPRGSLLDFDSAPTR